MYRKFLATAAALYALAICPAAYAGSYGEVTASPSYRNTYMVSTPFFTPATLCTDFFQIAGSSSKKVRLTKLFVNASNSQSDKYKFFVFKRSTASSGGTSSAGVAVPVNSSMPSATASSLYFTANPTVGSVVGQVNAVSFFTNGVAQGGGANVLYDCGMYDGALTLNSASEAICISAGGVTLPDSPSLQVTAVFEEY